MADKHKKPISYKHSGVFTSIELPALEPDPYISVVVVEYENEISTVIDLVAKTTDGGFSLRPANSTKKLKPEPKSRRGTVPEHLVIDSPQKFKWKIFIDEPGIKTVDVSYSFQKKTSGGKIALKVVNNTLTHAIVPTGKTVGEPNVDWVIDNFKANRIGELNFPAEGFYEIEVTIEPDKKEEVKFQWIWLQ